jgi:serine/threonine protein kinase
MKVENLKMGTSCPSTTELQQLLGGSLSGDQQAQYEEHLAGCGCCQAKLEEVAVAGSDLSQVVRQCGHADTPATSAYWPALKSLDLVTPPAGATPVGAATPQSGDSPATVRRRNVELSFLAPATDGAYLGRLAHFDVMRIIGRGGMGVVLEAFDSKLQRNVAIKVLDPELAEDDVARQRFCREARAAASITHENVVAVHQVEHAVNGQLPFIVMQLVPGEALEDRLRRGGRMPIREIVRIALQTAQGLAAAHAQNLIHRDIKPGNILLEQPGDRVKLSDFGLARVEDDVKLTRTGFVSGTPLYMAPEQATGEEPDQRSDLFSLGAVMYEMCAGAPPFQANTPLAILKHITETPQRPIRELNPNVPEWLAYTIDRLLAKKPADRIQTAAHLAEMLEFQWALMKTSSEDVPTVCAEEEHRRVVRSRWIAGAIAAVALALGIYGGMFFANRGVPTSSTDTLGVSSAEPTAVLSANSGAVWAVSFSPTMPKVAMAVEDGTVRLWDLPSKSVEAMLDAHRGTVWAARYSPDGSRLATAGDDGLIKIWDTKLSDTAHPEPVLTLKHPNAVRTVAFARDGKSLVAADRSGGLRVWSLDAAPPAADSQAEANVKDAEQKPLAETEQPGAVYAVALSPDGTTLATAGSDKVVRLWNARTLAPKLTLEGHAGPVFGLAFHPDGRRLVSVGWDKTVRIWDAGSGQSLKSWEADVRDVWSVAYSPDGTKLVTGGTTGAVKLWNAETADNLATFLGHTSAVHTVAFDAQGKQISSGGRDGTARIWNVD